MCCLVSFFIFALLITYQLVSVYTCLRGTANILLFLLQLFEFFDVISLIIIIIIICRWIIQVILYLSTFRCTFSFTTSLIKLIYLNYI